jgi:GNAT superfamily N-acetyltransferase
VNINTSVVIRQARQDDCAAIQTLIEVSARQLGADDYDSEQIEAALRGVWGLDTQLVRDRTYFVAAADTLLVGCGGWSFRRTLFGADSLNDRDDIRLDPKTEAAKIRAFFVHPAYVRRGFGRKILRQCELAATNHGFSRLELGATLPGERLYRACGYVASKPSEYDCSNGIFMMIIPMNKVLGSAG